MKDLRRFIKTTIREFLLLEAKYSDIEVIPSEGVQRGTSDERGRSFDIVIGNPSVYYKMEKTPMGKGNSRIVIRPSGRLIKGLLDIDLMQDKVL